MTHAIAIPIVFSAIFLALAFSQSIPAGLFALAAACFAASAAIAASFDEPIHRHAPDPEP